MNHNLVTIRRMIIMRIESEQYENNEKKKEKKKRIMESVNKYYVWNNPFSFLLVCYERLTEDY